MIEILIVWNNLLILIKVNFIEIDVKLVFKVKKEKCKNIWSGIYGLVV